MKRRFLFNLFLLLCSLSFVFAQERTIKGQVVDSNGFPLQEVFISVQGTENSVLSDENGNYSIQAKEGDVIVFDYIGFAKKTEKVGKSTKAMNVTLVNSNIQELSEVVTTGITSTDKRLFTGASDRLDASSVKIDGLPDVSRGLEGRSAGVTVQNVSGSFGSAPKIRVRGATSIYGSSKPLWVVDGVIMEDVVEMNADDLASGDALTLISSAIAGLNPDDIQSFEILKDGSATSIYGARAMAGVIVVTTKRGSAGLSNINYTGEFTYRQIPSYSNFNIMNSQQQISVYEEMRNAGWLNYSDLVNARESGIYGKMYELLNKLDSNGNFLLANTPESKAAFLREAQYRNTDWFKQLFNSNISQSHSVSLSSGTEKSTYYASLSALVDPGWTLSSNVNRYTANFNSNFKIRDNLNLMVLSSGSYRKQKAPGTLAQDVDIVSGKVKRDFDINPYSFALNSSRTLDPDKFYTRNYAPFNIKHELNENYIDINVADLKFQTELKWKPIKSVETSLLGAIKYQSTSQEHHVTEFSNQAKAYRAMPNTTVRDNNPYLYTNPDNPYALPISVLPAGGIYSKTDHTMYGYDMRATASYKNEFNNIHTVNFYLGAEMNAADRKRNNFTGWGMQYSLGENPFYIYELFKKGVEENNLYYGLYNSKYRNLAFFSNATYSWKKKYTLNATLRYEGTNKLGKSRSARWLPTWNISGAWDVSRENFFDDLYPTVSDLIVKASYSLTADRGPASVTNSLVDIRSSNYWKPLSEYREGSLYINQLENSELTYEKKHELNLGLQTGFLDNRIMFNADWYKRNNYDLIGVVTTQGLGGQIQKFGNIADMKSSGLELSLQTTNIKTDDFRWDTSFIYSKIKNKVTNLKTRARTIDLVTRNGFAKEGLPVRSIFSIPFQGLNEEGLPTFLNQNGETTVTDIYFQEREKLDYLVYSGNADPTDVGSFGNTFQYKGFKLNIFTTYSFGNVVRLNPVFSNSYSDLAALPRDFENRWTVSGDEKRTNIPVLADKRMINAYGSNNLAIAYNAYNYSTSRIASGDFIRLKEVSLSYDFSHNLIKNIGFRNLSLKLQATNLFLLYADKKLKGQDPEFINSGGVALPVPKQFTLTLRAGL
ncbi:Outer membrane cobalamin receptor protein [Candidatus Ornithobacterium hominis]|uniref:Outer membrane cobalamin receptor protein n=1 Tax=Candidatus Ornithobacterium hominis TaxID=2497989 RepID=A0A383U1N3_9FLAO|nr:SusC/RagA family TonB-linked outer membrane protein [Candidatus Ornithobacterium hominis]MCT7904913.1 SusC/RagA family TonB-linked outer membrane protein [Candidatus Ornithobacterium hominis]SZD73420.1 Outer membrane cobalamin receptor protein [Candidatus Ornithobacterium hominis]